jgi:ribose transport system ATP-binding protein
MGFEEVPYLLIGAERARDGVVAFGGQTMRAAEITPPRALAARLVLVPGNRSRDGLIASLTVLENLALPILSRNFRGFMLRHRKIRAAVERRIRDFDVRPADPKRPMWSLSGGNQQKAVLAKWYQTDPLVLLLHEPTAGVDIGARKQIFELIGKAAANHSAVLIASQEYEDLAHMCDRVLIFRNGRMVAELSGVDLSEDRLVEQCYRDVPRNANSGFDQQSGARESAS